MGSRYRDVVLVHNALGQGSSPDIDGHVDERADEQTREPECPQAATSDLCGCWFIGLPDPNRLSGQDGRDGVLVDEVGLTISPEQNGIAVEPCHITLKPDAIGQKDRDQDLVLAQVLQHGVLERVRALYDHSSVSLEVFTPRPTTPTCCQGLGLGRVDGFDDDEAQSECDEGSEVPVRFLATERNALEALELADEVFDAGAGAIERL